MSDAWSIRKMKEWLITYWEHCVALIIPIIIIIVMPFFFSKIKPSGDTVIFSNEMLLGGIMLMALFFPLLFAVFRRIVIAQNVQEVKNDERLIGKWIDVSYKRFAIPLSLLVSTIPYSSYSVPFNIDHPLTLGSRFTFS